MKHLLARAWRTLHLPKHVQLRIMRLVNDEFLVGVTGVIVNDQGKVLVLKHTYRQTEWSLPGGYLKRGEHPREGIAREILEETGFRVRVKKIIKTTHDSQTARLDIACYGKFIGGTFRASAEVSDFGFFDFDHLPEIGTKQQRLIREVLDTELASALRKQSFFHKFRSFFGKK